MSQLGHVGPQTYPGWWDIVRQIVMFGIACWLIVVSVMTPSHDIPFLVTALILFGLIPAERVIARKSNGRTE